MRYAADEEFARQALLDSALTQAQLNECLGAQEAYADRGTERALPVIAFELGFLDRFMVERLLRHQIRRTGAMKIGAYRLREQIGRGGMGIVYRADHSYIQRIVAVKLFLYREMSERTIRRFEREWHTLARLSHRNLVVALDVGQAEGWHYYAMEYVDGVTLARRVDESGPLEPREAVNIAQQVAEALAHAHANGIVHRDVKPSNVMIARNNTVKLCDLGLAKVRDVDESEMYAAGRTVGSPHYMAPEQVAGRKDIDGRADIYALGLVLYFALTGEHPFGEIQQREKVMRQHLRGRLRWPSHVNPKISDDLAWMITRMTALDPACRYETAAELASDLRDLGRRLEEAR